MAEKNLVLSEEQMIVASIFGTTDGLEVQNLPVGPGLAIKLEDGAVAFASQDVVLKTDRDIFRINRREVSGKSLTWIGLYREATEIVSNRPGGYYGAGLWLYDIVVPGQLVAETLVNLADQIKNLAISGGKFTKRIADIRGSIVPPAQVSQLLTTKKPLVTGISPNSPVNALISNQETAAASTIEWAQVSHSAELFNELLIGHPEQLQPRQGQFQKTTERFDSVASAIQWAYNKRVIQLDGMLQKQKSELDGASQQLTQLKAEIGNKQAECESVRIELSNTRREVQTAWDQKNRAQQQYEMEMQHLKSQLRGAPQQPIRPVPPKYPSGPQGAEGVARAHHQERGFFAQNWPLLSLIAVLMIALGGLGFMFQQINQAVTKKEVEIKEEQKKYEQLKEEKLKAENALKAQAAELEVLKKKSEPKKAEGKEATPVEFPFTAEPGEKGCKSEDFIKFTYVIDETGKTKNRQDIYSAIASDCKFDKLIKTCDKTITAKIKGPFTKDAGVLTGEIVLPKNCNGGKPFAISKFGVTLTPVKTDDKPEEKAEDKSGEMSGDKKTNAPVMNNDKSTLLQQ